MQEYKLKAETWYDKIGITLLKKVEDNKFPPTMYGNVKHGSNVIRLINQYLSEHNKEICDYIEKESEGKFMIKFENELLNAIPDNTFCSSCGSKIEPTKYGGMCSGCKTKYKVQYGEYKVFEY